MTTNDLVSTGKRLEEYVLQNPTSKHLCEDFNTSLLTASLVYVPGRTFCIDGTPAIRVIDGDGALSKWYSLQLPTSTTPKRFNERAMEICDYIAYNHLPLSENGVDAASINRVVENFCSQTPLAEGLSNSNKSIEILLLPTTAKTRPGTNLFSTVIAPKSKRAISGYTIIVPCSVADAKQDIILQGVVSALSVCLCDIVLRYIPQSSHDQLLSPLKKVWELCEDERVPPSVDMFFPSESVSSVPALKLFASWVSAIYKPVAAHIFDSRSTLLDNEVENVLGLARPRMLAATT